MFLPAVNRRNISFESRRKFEDTFGNGKPQLKLKLSLWLTIHKIFPGVRRSAAPGC